MPRMDGTGPFGQGPMTGRGMGRCGGMRGMNAPSRGYGANSGFQRSFSSPKNQLKALEEDEKMLLEELDALRAEKEHLQKQDQE